MIPFAVQLIPSGILLIGAFFLRESPRWLFLRGRREEAIDSLCWLRKLSPSDTYIRQEIAMIDAAIEDQKVRVGLGYWQPFKAVGRSRKVQYRLFLGSMFFFWQNGSGINAINYYSPTVFKSVGVRGPNTGMLTTGLYGVVKMVCTIFWILFLVDHVGRRNLLLYGAAGGTVCLWIIGGYIKVAQPEAHPKDKVDSGGIAAIFFFYLWTCFYSMSWNGIPWIYNAVRFFFPFTHDKLDKSLLTLSYLLLGNVRSQCSRNCTSMRGSEQLALELPRLPLHTSDVLQNGLWSVLLLCLTDSLCVLFRLLPCTGDKGGSP